MPAIQARTAIWCCAILISVSALASSRASDVAAHPLTLPEAIAQALSGNGNLKAARSAVLAARGKLRQSGLWPNPRLTFSGETDAAFANDGEFAGALALEQAFPIAGRLSRQEDVARVDVALALAELNDAERKLLGDVSQKFFEIAATDRQIALRDHLLAISGPLATASQKRYRAGEVSILDMNTAAMEFERMRQEQTVLRGDRTAKLTELMTLLGASPQVPVMIDTRLPPAKAPSLVATLQELGLQQRPDLRLAELSVNKAASERALASASGWEDWSVSLGVQRSRTVLEGVPPQGTDKAVLFSLAVPLPLFNRNQGDVAAAAANEVGARQKQEALKLAITQEIAGQHEQLTRLASAIDGFSKGVLPLSASNIEQASIAYGKGQIGIAELVQVERQALEMNNGYEALLSQYYATVAALDTATFAWADQSTHVVEETAVAGDN